MGILLEITIYSAVIFVLIMGFKLVFKNKISPNLHYMVWALLLIRLIMPFTLETGSLIVIPSPEPQIAATEITPPTVEKSPIPQTSGTHTTTVQPQIEIAPIVPEITQIVPQVRPLTTEQILIIVWIFGMVVYGGFIGMQMFRARKRFASQMPVTEYLQGILDKCREKMDIKRKVKLHCHFGLVSPCLTFTGKILMPAEILAGSTDEEISHMIMHELAHYKRKDHIMLIVMAILRAVYWFNPVVWLAYGKVREDMERACDGVVVNHLENGEKAHYANTILTVMTRPGKQVFALGMADVITTAKKRIEGIFMKQNTKLSVKIIAIFTALIISVACFTTACQPTPQEPIVVQKVEENVEKILSATPSVSQQVVEEDTKRWQEQFTTGNGVQITIDADVTVPDATEFPVYRVAPIALKIEQIRTIADYFNQGDITYENTNFTPTKEQLAVAVLEAKQELARMEASEDQTDKDNIQNQHYQIEQLEEAYERCVWESELELIEMDIVDMENYTGVMFDAGKQKYASFSVRDEREDFGAYSVRYSNPDTFEEYIDYDTSSSIATGTELTLEDCKALADSALKGMGIDFMQFAYNTVDNYYIPTMSMYPEVDKSRKVYSLIYTRNIGDMFTGFVQRIAW